MGPGWHCACPGGSTSSSAPYQAWPRATGGRLFGICRRSNAGRFRIGHGTISELPFVCSRCGALGRSPGIGQRVLSNAGRREGYRCHRVDDVCSNCASNFRRYSTDSVVETPAVLRIPVLGAHAIWLGVGSLPVRRDDRRMTDRRLSANLRGGARTLEAAQMPALVDTRPRAQFKERAGVGQFRPLAARLWLTAQRA